MLTKLVVWHLYNIVCYDWLVLEVVGEQFYDPNYKSKGILKYINNEKINICLVNYLLCIRKNLPPNLCKYNVLSSPLDMELLLDGLGLAAKFCF